jgi:hypothetical protein
MSLPDAPKRALLMIVSDYNLIKPAFRGCQGKNVSAIILRFETSEQGSF